MGQPKRKQSKQRSRKRRGAVTFALPQLAKDPQDGTRFRPHQVNPANGMYRGRQVLDIEV
jgi:large subunit ribosomal protein L32